MKIAIIGWGSLVNDRKSKLSVGKWQKDGPEIPLEFSRISKDGRLTPVINEKAGKSNKVFFALSKFKEIDKAFNQLVKHERISPARIGVIDVKNKKRAECTTRHEKTAQVIAQWAKKKKVDAVLWNALGTSFKEKIDTAFSPESALSYLEGLDKKEQKAALAYIKSVPVSIKTPTRQLINEELIG